MAEYTGAWSRREAAAFLNEATIPLRLACRTPSGRLWVVSLWFRHRDGGFECATAADADVVRFLQSDPGVAFEVSTNEPPYRGVRGNGTASVLSEGARNWWRRCWSGTSGAPTRNSPGGCSTRTARRSGFASTPTECTPGTTATGWPTPWSESGLQAVVPDAVAAGLQSDEVGFDYPDVLGGGIADGTLEGRCGGLVVGWSTFGFVVGHFRYFVGGIDRCSFPAAASRISEPSSLHEYPITIW